MVIFFFFFFKQKTAYEIVPCDWSSDVCSSDLHGNRPLGNVREVREPGLSHLLAAAGLIQVNDEIAFFGLEIRRRVIERQMAILADSDKGDVNRCCGQLLRDFANRLRNISVTLKKVILVNFSFPNQTLEEVFPKAGGMRRWQADVFIQVKHLNARPLDAGHSGQSVEKLELRGARRGNDSRPAAFLYCLAEGNGGLLRRSPPQRGLVFINLNDHR